MAINRTGFFTIRQAQVQNDKGKKMTNKKQKLKFLAKLAYLLVIVFMVLVAGVTAFPALNLTNGYKFLTVQSGSMEPTIGLGNLVLIKPVDRYLIGEVISFSDQDNSNQIITHRLWDVEKTPEQTYFITKGDANDAPDKQKITKDQIVGKVIFNMPLLGYLFSFAKTLPGLIVMIIVPAIIIIWGEIFNIRNEVQKTLEKKRFNQAKESLIVKFIFIISLCSLGLFSFATTQARLSDQTEVSMTVTAGAWTQPNLECNLNNQTNDFNFRVENITDDYQQVSYELFYLSAGIPQGVVGQSPIENESFSRNIYLGTCSGEICSPHEDIDVVHLEILLGGNVTTELVCSV